MIESREDTKIVGLLEVRLMLLLRLNPDKIMKKTYRIKTNNQELLIRKQNESDATS